MNTKAHGLAGAANGLESAAPQTSRSLWTAAGSGVLRRFPFPSTQERCRRLERRQSRTIRPINFVLPPQSKIVAVPTGPFAGPGPDELSAVSGAVGHRPRELEVGDSAHREGVSEGVSVGSDGPRVSVGGAVAEQWWSSGGAVVDTDFGPFIINALHRGALPDSDPRLQQLLQCSGTTRHCSPTTRLTWFLRPSSSRSVLTRNGLGLWCAGGKG